MNGFVRFLIVAIFGIGTSGVSSAWAADCYSVSAPSGGNWSSASNWYCGSHSNGPPGSGDTAEITSDSPITLNQNATVDSITVDDGAVFSTDNNNRTLTLSGGGALFTLSASGAFIPGNSTVAMSPNASTMLTSGAITFNNLQLSPAISQNRTYTFGAGNLTINGNFDIDPSKGSGSTRTLTVNMAGSIAVGGTTTVEVSGSRARAVLNTNGNALSSGRLDVENNATFTANGSTITLTGTTSPLITVAGTFNVGTSTVSLNGASSVALVSAPIDLYNLTVNMPGFTGTLGADVSVANQLTLTGGTLAVSGNTLTLNGPAIAGTPASLSTTSASSLYFGGNSSGITLPSSVASLNRLIVDNANGLTLAGSPTVAALVLSNGAITTGGNILAVSPNCTTGPVSHSSGYVIGYLRLTFPSGAHTCTFDIGSSTAYAPLSLAVNASGSGTLSASTTGNEHPQISSSPIDATKDANRYWTIGTGGDTLAALITSYGATFNFISGDLDSVATTGDFTAASYSGGVWTALSPVTAGSLSAGVSGVAGPIVTPTDYVIGEAASVCSIPSGLPDNMTCVCDNFGRATLNPSTIYGGNWSLSKSGGSFGVPQIVKSGYLRMTDNSTGDATAATMPGVFPAAGNLIQIEFKHYAYNGGGADGIALTLSDASQAPVPGAFGGSLGYAQKAPSGVNGSDCTSSSGCPGFVGGWVGIALDEYGGFSANTEGRAGGSAPGATSDAVAIRGSGSGLSGYPYMAGTGTLSPGIDNPGSIDPANGDLYRIKVDARNYTSSNKTTMVSVDRDTSGTGDNYTSVVAPFDAFSANTSQAAVPTNWKLSFTGSTGSLTNIHEIGALKICAQTITPPAGYRIQVDNLAPSTCGTAGGSPSSPAVTVTALDTNGNTVTTYNETVTLSATLSDGTASHASWSLKSGSGSLSGNQYTFASADQGTAQFYLTDTSTENVYVTVSENGGTLSSSTPSTQPVQFSGGTFTISSTDPLSDGVVAGRAHQLTITKTTCSWRGSGTDTSYSGTQSLDGWYTPDSDHPAGALAPQICARNVSNTCLPAPGACQTLSIAAPNLDSNSNNISLPFINGAANFCLGTSDVGKFSVFLRDDSNVSSAIIGSSNVLTVRPFAVVVSNITSSNGDNPAISSPEPTAGSPIFTVAGANFSGTVAGYLWNKDGDTGLDGLPGSGANRTAITAAGLATHYEDTVNLSANKFAPSTPADSPAGTGVAGSISGGSVAVTHGSTTQLSLAYSEVGSFSLHAQPSTAYLNSSDANLTDRVVYFANPALNTQSSWVGRFKPDHFTISGTPTIVPRIDANNGDGCLPAASFTYMEEPMQIGFTLQAVAADQKDDQGHIVAQGNVTQNYAGSYAHFSPGAADWLTRGSGNGMGLWMLGANYSAGGGTCQAVFSANATAFQSCTGTAPSSLTGQRVTLSGTPDSAIWNGGVATFSANVMLKRADQDPNHLDPDKLGKDGPYDSLQLGIAPQDTEGVSLANSDLDFDADNDGTGERKLLGTTKVRYGRLSIPSMYGSELLPLPITVQAQYWNGSTQTYVNSDDECTSIDGSNFIVSNPYGGGISSGMVSVQGSGTLNNGSGTITLSKPSPAPSSKGYLSLYAKRPSDAEMIPQLGAYLPGFGVETFGVYRGGRVIYLREGHY